MNSRASGPPRMMLVDLQPDADVHNKRTIAFPFLMGLSRLIGWRACWNVIGVRYDPTFLYTLPPPDLELLLSAAARAKPRVMVLNERLEKAQLSSISRAAPGGRLVYWNLEENIHLLARNVRKLIPEARSSVLHDPRLLDRIQPVYRRKILNHAPWAVNPLIEVVGGARCSYHAPVAKNPFYRRLRLPSAAMRCAFCSTPDKTGSGMRLQDPVAFVVKQIEAIRRGRHAAGARIPLTLCGGELWKRFEELSRALVRRGARGVELGFMPRLDELLAARGAVDRCLPLLAKSGIALRITGLGVENFSPDENMRLHKGITAEQVHEAASFLIKTNARWPGHFPLPSGGFGMILFTPWTRLEDLRINIANIERCPLIDRSFALGRRLMLFPDAAITRLAEQDGLIAKASEGIFYNAGCKNSFDQNEIPWRFANPEIGTLWPIARCLSSDRSNIPAKDPVMQAVAAFIRSATEGPFDPLRLFRQAVDAIGRHPRIRSPIALLDRLRARRS